MIPISARCFWADRLEGIAGEHRRLARQVRFLEQSASLRRLLDIGEGTCDEPPFLVRREHALGLETRDKRRMIADQIFPQWPETILLVGATNLDAESRRTGRDRDGASAHVCRLSANRRHGIG